MPPANISVIIGAPGNINVQTGSNNPRVSTIDYGGRTLLSATDLNIGAGPQDGEIIAYSAANNSFVLETPGQASLPSTIDAGTY